MTLVCSIGRVCMLCVCVLCVWGGGGGGGGGRSPIPNAAVMSQSPLPTQFLP